jgi:hypothetical protein
MNLPEDDPDVFDHFLDWLNDDTAPILSFPKYSKDELGSKNISVQFCKAFFWAEKYCINAFANKIIDDMQDIQHIRGNGFRLSCIQLIYKNTYQSSKLRLHAAATVALWLAAGHISEESKTYIMARARKNADFGADILKIYDDFGKRLYEFTSILKSKPKVADQRRGVVTGGRLGGGGSNRSGDGRDGGPPGPGRDVNLHLRSVARQCYFHTHVKGEIYHGSKKE